MERPRSDASRPARDVEPEPPDVEPEPPDVEPEPPDVEPEPPDVERDTRDVEREPRDAKHYPADLARPVSHAARSCAFSARPIADAQCYPADAMDSGAGGPNDPRDVLRKDASIAKKLLGYAYTKTRNITRAQDAAQEAIARVLEGKGWYAWKPDAKSLLDHLCDVVDTVVANESRRAGKRRERPIRSKDDEGNPVDDAVPDSAPNVSQQIESLEEEQHEIDLAARVMLRIEKDPIIPRMLQLEQDETSDAAEQARLLGCRVPDIYRARERLAYHRDVVLREEEEKGGAR
jgi:DNA-directed RNA polymerase specialized sigma24 family protein